ncbi:esterase-like activity of phytase family protein [Sulfitobacter sp. D35]|uniref:esterase-like activity of phytase family protein n=1 Tax=Sulfitobacter sp. D35 TaxID=3083252 RepID=UPI00296E7D43|nr:esterase-like activity of phytase family protein [Sulfitobacter sp. D35]MDW4498266.1 esterase-like activity of phytase family protein [Sulfitobacter sp. D35]
MRWRAAVGLIAAVAVLGTYYRYYPAGPSVAPEDQPAQLVSAYRWSVDEDWFGGISGIEMSLAGDRLLAVTDRGRIIDADVSRDDAGAIDGISLRSVNLLRDPDGADVVKNRIDAEGLAVGPDGRIYVSFERVDRVWSYGTVDGPAEWESYTRAWRAMANNGGLEALALSPDGSLYAIEEETGRGARETLIHRRRPGARWDQPVTLPLDDRFLPVGGDFGPDGRLYVLERHVYPFGFRSRVRAFTVTERRLTRERTVLQTRLGTHGNLEGLSVWRDGAGRIRLTMVADDNFLPIQRNQIVEYALTE